MSFLDTARNSGRAGAEMVQRSLDLVAGLHPFSITKKLGRAALPPVLGRLGSLELRLAQSAADIHAVQRLRYDVFFSEMAAQASLTNRVVRRDRDAFDRICDHLMVLDTEWRATPESKPVPRVVGTYRLLRCQRVNDVSQFYSAQEFDFEGFLSAHPGMSAVELGRSCVLQPYRNRRTVELLWRGIWQYVRHHNIGLLFGCASLEGTNPDALAAELSFLHKNALAPEAWRIRPVAGRYVRMDRCDALGVDEKRVLAKLPPLIKAYLRVGARFGNGAVVDRGFGTTDVFVALRVADIDPRYIDYYS